MNRKSVIKLILIVQLLLFDISSFSQSLSSPFVVKTYSTKDGLPHSGAFSCMQDSRGYLWVGTVGGVCRFDGQKFFNYTRNEEVKDLVVSCTFEDEIGRIWMYSGWSLYYMDNKNIYPFINGDSISLNLVYRNGDMTQLEWWAKSKQGISRIGKNGLEKLNPPTGIRDGYCPRIIETNRGYYYSDTTGLFFVANSGKKTSIEEFIPRTSFIVIMGYWNQKLYFYNKKGVFIYDDSGVTPLFEKQLSGKRVFTSFRDSKNRIWVATAEGGVFVSKPNEEEKLDYKIMLPSAYVSSFYEDKEANIWVTSGEGLAKIEEAKYELLSSEDFSLLTDLNNILIDKKNSLLLFSESNGLINRQNNSFQWKEQSPLKGHLIDASCFDDKNKLWCVTRYARLLAYDNKEVIDYTPKIRISESRSVKLDIAYDQYRKKVWLTADSLILINERELVPFKDIDNKVVLDPQLILPIQDGNVIVLTAANNLFIIDKNNYIRNLHPFNTMIPQRIHKLFTDSSGGIWISYFGIGLLHCSIQNDTNLVLIDKYTRENGLGNETIKSIAFDKKGRLWAATMNGISVIDFSDTIMNNNRSFFSLSVSNGLPGKGLEYGRLACDASGDMWYSTQYALMKFPANEINITEAPPYINIEEVSANLQKTNWQRQNDSLLGFFQLPSNTVLKYFENTITINFKAISLAGNGDFQYSYFIKGLTDSWSTVTTNNSITLTKLKPGKYDFLVKTRKIKSGWSEPVSFSFTIKPALWQHWWFNPLLALVFFGIIYWLYLFRIKQIKREEKVRRRLASDLHDDIGSTLSSISYYSEAIRKQVKDSKPEVIPLLDKMEAASGNTVDAMSDIVWATNPSFDKGVNLLIRMRSYAAEICSLKNINLEFETDPVFENAKLNMAVRRNVFLIFKEAVNNAVKYSDCSLLCIHIGQGIIEINDNGKGFDTQKEFAGNGLKNIQQRAKEIKGSLELSSSTEKGTSVILKY